MPGKHYEQGTYLAKIVGHVFGESKSKKTPFIEIHFEPLEASGANTLPDQVYNRHFRLYFSEAAAPYSIENLRRIGWKGTKLRELDPDGGGADALVGIEVNVSCEYNDEGYENWSLAFGGGGGVPKDSAKGVPDRLDKIFGKAIKASAPAKQKVAVVDEDDDDDSEDIPF